MKCSLNESGICSGLKCKIKTCSTYKYFRTHPKPVEEQAKELIREIRGYMKNVAMFKADYLAIEEIIAKYEEAK